MKTTDYDFNEYINIRLSMKINTHEATVDKFENT